LLGWLDDLILKPSAGVHRRSPGVSVHNRRILFMEWMAAGITHISIGVLAILATAIDGPVIHASLVRDTPAYGARTGAVRWR
jgi:hypothetical protein